MSLRRHVWLPGNTSACQLAQNTGEIERSGLDPDTVPSCGPCLVAVSVLSQIAEKMLEVQPAPVHTVREATEELLAGEFAQVGHVERIASIMDRAAAQFQGWFTYVVAPGPHTPDPGEDPTSTPPAAGPTARAQTLDVTGAETEVA